MYRWYIFLSINNKINEISKLYSAYLAVNFSKRYFRYFKTYMHTDYFKRIKKLSTVVDTHNIQVSNVRRFTPFRVVIRRIDI